MLLIIIFLKRHPPQESAIDTGLKGTKYKDRIFGSQSPHYKKSFEANQLIGGDVLNKTIMYVSAIMEVKSSMGIIVAAPTAGSCGGLPCVLFGTADCINKNEDAIIKAILWQQLTQFLVQIGYCPMMSISCHLMK